MASDDAHKIRIIEDPWATFRHVIEAVAIVAAGLWAFYIFVYQEKIKPSGEPPGLSEAISVARLGRDARRDIVCVTITYRNVGHTEIDLAADAYNVWGERFADHETLERDGPANQQNYRRELPLLERRVVRSFAELRDAAKGGIPGTHFTLEPGDAQSISETVVLPRGRYDVIAAQVIAVPIKTADARKVSVSIERRASGSVWLQPKDTDLFEDDNSTEFALVP